MRLYAPASVDDVVDGLLAAPGFADAIVADERRPARPAEWRAAARLAGSAAHRGPRPARA